MKRKNAELKAQVAAEIAAAEVEWKKKARRGGKAATPSPNSPEVLKAVLELLRELGVAEAVASDGTTSDLSDLMG